MGSVDHGRSNDGGSASRINWEHDNQLGHRRAGADDGDR